MIGCAGLPRELPMFAGSFRQEFHLKMFKDLGAKQICTLRDKNYADVITHVLTELEDMA